MPPEGQREAPPAALPAPTRVRRAAGPGRGRYRELPGTCGPAREAAWPAEEEVLAWPGWGEGRALLVAGRALSAGLGRANGCHSRIACDRASVLPFLDLFLFCAKVSAAVC